MTRACSTCAWWTRHASGPFGDCHGAPPTASLTSTAGYAFPRTYEDTWCAAYRRSEASIRSGNPGAEEILKHFEKEGRA